MINKINKSREMGRHVESTTCLKGGSWEVLKWKVKTS